MPHKPPLPAEDRAALASELRAWLDGLEITAAQGAGRLGVSPRTLEGILQGRGFSYPQMLRLAMQASRQTERQT